MLANKMSLGYSLFVATIVALGLYASAIQGDELGRLFTTAKERAMLEELRHERPIMDIEPIEIVVVEEEVEVVESTPVIEGVTVNGLVYRKGGRSTAWVNGTSTFDGDLESQYISVDTAGIRGDRVPVVMPDNVTRVELKVGQTYEPLSGSVIDVNESKQKPSSPAPSR